MFNVAHTMLLGKIEHVKLAKYRFLKKISTSLGRSFDSQTLSLFRRCSSVGLAYRNFRYDRKETFWSQPDGSPKADTSFVSLIVVLLVTRTLCTFCPRTLSS